VWINLKVRWTTVTSIWSEICARKIYFWRKVNILFHNFSPYKFSTGTCSTKIFLYNFILKQYYSSHVWIYKDLFSIGSKFWSVLKKRKNRPFVKISDRICLCLKQIWMQFGENFFRFSMIYKAFFPITKTAWKRYVVVKLQFKKILNSLKIFLKYDFLRIAWKHLQYCHIVKFLFMVCHRKHKQL
jgi:hypothetical protein